MLFTSEQELRFYFPTHAIDSLDPFLGVIDNSEHDFLQEKLGTPLYNALCDWYAEAGAIGSGSAVALDTNSVTPYNVLLLLCQRCIAYDAMSRAIELGIISPNNAGVNIPTSDDYGKVDLAAVEKFRTRCVTEAHAAINRLLQTLEEWCKENEAAKTKSEEGKTENTSDHDTEIAEIVELWSASRYYYLAAGMLIPSATVLQEYLNIYDSREKFIQMLPDLRFLQEEILASAIGEELMAYLVEFAATGQVPQATAGEETDATVINSLLNLLKKTRKYLAAALENRTLVLKTDKVRRQQAHDEAVRLLASLQQSIAAHQYAFPEAVINTSPLYTPPAAAAIPTTPSSDGSPVCCCTTAAQAEYHNNRRNSALFATPFLN